VAHGARVLKNLVIVAAFVRLVAEEVDGAVLDAADLLLGFHVLQAVRLVPARGEDVEGDLAADGVTVTWNSLANVVAQWNSRFERWWHIRKPQIRELLPHSLHKLLANLMLKIELLILVALLDCRIPANRAHVDHAIAEFHERAALHRDVQVGDVVQDEAHQLLVVVLANPLDETVRSERHAHADGREPVLGEAVVEESRDGDAGSAELFLLFGEIGAADEADGDFVAECGEELEHLRRDGLRRGKAVLACGLWLGGGLECAHSSRGRKGAVHIEEADRVLHRSLGERRDNARGGSSGGGHGVCF
jgi:hypothetical protein